MIKKILLLFVPVIVIAGCTPKVATTTASTTEAPVEATEPPPPPPPLPALPPPSSGSMPMDPKVRIGKLSNGMTYYIRANQKPENRAELRLAVDAGSMEEDDDQLGLAHLIEHMAFNGSTHFSKNELVDYLERMGSRFGPDLNAYTSFDRTVFMLQVRTDEQEQFDKGLLILKDWASGISFDSTEIEKERGVVISEWRSGLDADERMQQKYLPFVYYNSRYAKRLPIGDPKILQSASANVIKRFYYDWYRPEAMAIIVVGTIDPDTIEQQLKTMFSDIKSKTMARKKPSHSVPLHDQTFVQIHTDPEATDASVSLMYKHRYTPVKNLDDYRTRLTHTLYNRMLGRRLSDLTKQANPPFVFANTNYSHDVGDMATYSSFAFGEAKNIEQAFKSLLEENQRVLQFGFTESELEREKANLMRMAEQSVTEEDKMESSRVVGRYISNFLDQNPIPSAAQTMDLYKELLPTIKVDEISQLAKKWITDQNRVVLITGPEKDKAALPDSVKVVSLLAKSKTITLTPYIDVDLSAPLLEGQFPPQPIVFEHYDSTLNIYNWQFANGVRVKAKPTDFKNDEILMVGYSPGGNSNYPDEIYPSARSASNVVQMSGVGNYNAAALEKKLTGKRVSAIPFIFERYEGVNGNASVKDQETMLQLAYSYIVHYREDTVALNSFLTRERASLANLLSNPQIWFTDKVNRITSGYHPRRGIPTLASYDQINMKDIMAIYKDRFKDVSDMDFFFIGNFNPDSLKYLTSRYLGALPGGGRKDGWKDIGDRFPSGRIDSTFQRGAAPKTLVQFIFHGPDHFNADTAYLLQSLIDVARIELREKLREDEGGVYGVSIGGGQTQYPLEQYSIRINYNVDPARAEVLNQACLDVLRKLKEEIDPADILKITEAQRQGRIKELQTNQFWMNSFINSWINGTDLVQATQLEYLEKRIATLTPEVLMKAARKYFSEKELISLVMHPEKT